MFFFAIFGLVACSPSYMVGATGVDSGSASNPDDTGVPVQADDSGSVTDSGAADDTGSADDSGADPDESGTADDSGSVEDSDSGAADDTGSADDSGLCVENCGDTGSGSDDTGSVEDSGCTDVDGDGYCSTETGGSDCNDLASAVSPGATEILDNSVDENCDGVVETTPADTGSEADDTAEPEDTGAAYTDDDGDGWSVQGGDCNDVNPTINPAAVEVCDGLDNDCDGSVDEGVTIHVYLDADGDGYGDELTGSYVCTVASGYTTRTGDTDCNDNDATINPGAAEVLDDGIDQDCDGTDAECVPSATLTRVSGSAVEIDPGDDVTYQFTIAAGCQDIEVSYILLNVSDDAQSDVNWLDLMVDDRVESGYLSSVTTGEGFDPIEADFLVVDPDDILYVWDVDGWGGASLGALRGIDAEGSETYEFTFSGGGYLSGGETFTIEITEVGWYDEDGDYQSNVSSGASMAVTVKEADADADGHGVSSDCDDADDTVYPGAPEVADDGIDQDCDGADASIATLQDSAVCDGGQEACFRDVDGDGAYETLLMDKAQLYGAPAQAEIYENGYGTGCGIDGESVEANAGGFYVVSFEGLASCSSQITLVDGSYWWQNYSFCTDGSDTQGICVSTGGYNYLFGISYGSSSGLSF